MSCLGQDLGAIGGNRRGQDDNRAMRVILDTTTAEGAQSQPISVAVASRAHGRTGPSSSMEVGTAAVSGTGVSDQERQRQPRSKTPAWKDISVIPESMSVVQTHVKVKALEKGQREVSKQKVVDEFQDTTRWARILRVLGMNGSKKVHAAKGEWLNYDAQSYAMNFEKDSETMSAYSSQQLPKISGPGAREIVTVLLKRSPSTNRNGGFALIPKPVLVVKKEPENPLWKRRAIQAPAVLDVKRVGLGRRKRRNGNVSSHAVA